MTDTDLAKYLDSSIQERLKAASGKEEEELRFLSGRLSEALSSDDWARIGVVLGLLWYKFDRLLDIMRAGGEDLKHIRNRLAK